jgi:predicted amidophosphoribosyltransferase
MQFTITSSGRNDSEITIGQFWMLCPKCAKLIEQGDTYCRHCGEKLTPNYCSKCGKKLDC